MPRYVIRRPGFSLTTQSRCVQQNQKLDLARLHFAARASFYFHSEEHNARCLLNTRTEPLDETTTWTNSKDGKSMVLLSGMVGTGKSTIAQTVAQSRAARCEVLLQERRWQARQRLTAFRNFFPVPLRSTSFDQNGSRCGWRRQHVV